VEETPVAGEVVNGFDDRIAETVGGAARLKDAMRLDHRRPAAIPMRVRR
jgi:hypothetical protein